jgi:hypothetical protein
MPLRQSFESDRSSICSRLDPEPAGPPVSRRTPAPFYFWTMAAFRYRLVDANDGRDLGPFVSKRDDWQPGERIGRSKGEDLKIRAVIEPEDDTGFRAYLVVAAE